MKKNVQDIFDIKEDELKCFKKILKLVVEKVKTNSNYCIISDQKTNEIIASKEKSDKLLWHAAFEALQEANSKRINGHLCENYNIFMFM